MDWLIERFQSAPDNLAFIHEGRKFSYDDLCKTVAKFRERITESGLKEQQSVVILGDYSPEVFCLMLALALNHNIVIPLTRDSVVEESVALNVSGCDWYMEFDEQGSNFTIAEKNIEVSIELLDEFRKTGAPGIVLFSSGSTGKPKGILHDFNRVVAKFEKQRQPVIAIPFLMIDHFGGINTILAITASLGTVVTVADRSVSNICRAIEDYKVELLPATPSFLTLLLASKDNEKYDLSSLKRITYGTEVMPDTTLKRMKDTFPGVNLLQTYGLSEVGVLRSKSRDDGSLWVKVGGDGFKTKVVDEILWIKSDFAMIGYLNAPSEFDEDGWFNTQDRVEVDGDYFRILGRVTDLINVGGQKVYPSEIENVILELDNIEDVAVYGEPHDFLGHMIVAKVKLKSEEDLGSLKIRIRRACKQKLTSFKVPSKVILTEEDLYSARQKKVRKH